MSLPPSQLLGQRQGDSRCTVWIQLKILETKWRCINRTAIQSTCKSFPTAVRKNIDIYLNKAKLKKQGLSNDKTKQKTPSEDKAEEQLGKQPSGVRVRGTLVMYKIIPVSTSIASWWLLPRHARGALSQTWGHLGVARNLNTSASWHTGEQASKEGKINKFMEGLHLITTCLWAKPNHKSSCKQTIQEHYFVLLTHTVVFKSRSSSKHCKELILIVLINRMHFSTTLYSFATGRLNQVPKKKKKTKNRALDSHGMEEATLLCSL